MRIKVWLRQNVVVCIIGVLACISSPVSATELTFADSFPLKHYLSKEGMVWWMARVTELSGDSVTFRHFPAGQLAKAKTILSKVHDGAIDAGYIGIGYVTDKLPLTGAAMLPGLSTDPVTGSNVFWQMVKEGSLRAEFDKNKIVPLFAVVLPSYQLALGRDPATGMADLKGIKLRSSGALSMTAKAIGAVPVSMSAPEIYLGMQRGTLDGSLLPAISVRPYNIHETIKSFSTNGRFGTFAVTAGMNVKTFNKLNKEQKQAVIQAGEDTVKHLATWMSNSETGEQKKLAELGIKTYALSDEFLTKLDPALESVQKEWTKRMEGRGLDGAAIIEEFKALLEKQ